MPNPPDETADNWLPFLASFAEPLGGLPPMGVYGREAEVAQVLQALASPLKGRVVVIGPARVGKTAVILAAAHALTRGGGACPPELQGRAVWRFTPGNLPGLGQGGQWQAALEHLNAGWARHPEIILCLEDLPRAARLPAGTTEDGNRAVDVATLFAAGLRRHSSLCLAEAEEEAWRRFVEAYPDYARLFLPIRIAAPPDPAARRLIRRVADDLGLLNGTGLHADAVEQAYDLSERYLLDRAQPGKTIDLLQDALAVARRGADNPLTADDVTARFAEQTGLPRMLLDDSVPFEEPAVRQLFKSRVLAQDQAVEAILQVLSLLRARVNNPLRPMGVLLFLGPTGVGKTELARTLAEYLYGDRDRLVRFNMADYTDPYRINELFGAPYAEDVNQRRGLITNRLSGRAFAVVVLDEFEKAHPFVYYRFLQLFDEGLLLNGNDEVVNLRNAIIILTSNFGAQLVEHGRLGFAPTETFEMREKRVIAETERYFTPEFMNRMDAVCIFHPLTRAVMADIARREIGDLLRRQGLLRRHFDVDIADDVIEHVVQLGYSPSYGARYLKRQIEKTIAYPLARQINALTADEAGGTIRLYLKNGRVQSAYLAAAAPAGREAPPAQPTGADDLSLDDVRAALPVLAARVEALEEVYGLATALAEREAVLAELADVNFWNDASAARRRLDAYQRASGVVEQLSELRRALDALTTGCAGPAPDLEALSRRHRFLSSALPRIEFASFLSGPYDTHGAYLQIGLKSKATGARHWVATLTRMYLNWAKGRGLSAAIVGEDASPEGRSVSVTLAVSGFGVFGLLQGESGAHRLLQTVKVNGQDSLQRFTANVAVLPDLGEDDLPPAPADLRTLTKGINRAGLLVSHLTAQATAQSAELAVTLAGNMPADELAAEAARLVRIRLLIASGDIAGAGKAPALTASDVVRTYIRNMRDKGVHDHRTGRRSLKVKQVLEGEIQAFLDAALELRRGS